MTNKKYSVLLVEDMAPARQLLTKFIETRTELELCGIAKNGNEALQKMNSRKYDLVLLDIHLPVMSGIEVLERLTSLPYVIFTTAYDEYAIKAFDVGAVDYLLKPIDIDRFQKAIDRFIDVHKNEKADSNYPHSYGLSFMEKGKHYFIALYDIIYLSSHGKHSVVHTEEKDFEPAVLLKDLEQKLNPQIFLRIHKQFVVNINYITSLQYNQGGKYNTVLRDGDETLLPVGRTYAAQLKDRLKL